MFRKRQGFKSAVESLEVSGNASNGDCIDTKPGMVIKPDDFIFTNLHKLLRFKGREYLDYLKRFNSLKRKYWEKDFTPFIHTYNERGLSLENYFASYYLLVKVSWSSRINLN